MERVLRINKHGDFVNFTLEWANRNASSEFEEHQQSEALMYIVVVILFYSMVILVLMVKFIRSERSDARLTYYYEEFVNRDKFRKKTKKESVKRLASKTLSKKGVDV